jgi:nitrogen-specific signal transduction histidine kinase
VFAPFLSGLNNTAKESRKNRGLSVTYRIVNDQKGFIDVISEPGRGSIFHIYLPIPKEHAAFVDVTGDKKIDEPDIAKHCFL